MVVVTPMPVQVPSWHCKPRQLLDAFTVTPPSAFCSVTPPPSAFGTIDDASTTSLASFCRDEQYGSQTFVHGTGVDRTCSPVCVSRTFGWLIVTRRSPTHALQRPS